MRALVGVASVVLVLGAGGAQGQSAAPSELVFASTRAPDLHDEIHLVDTGTGTWTSLSDSVTDDSRPALSPDRLTLAFSSDRGGRGEAVWVWRAGRELHRLHPPLEGSIEEIRWSPDGSRLAFRVLASRVVEGVYVAPARGGPARRVSRGYAFAWVTAQTLVTSETAGVAMRTLSGRLGWRRPGGLHAASSRGEVALVNDGRLEVVNGRTGKLRVRLGRIGFAAWSPDGALLAYGNTTGRGIRILDRAGRARVVSRSAVLALDGWWPDGRSVLAHQGSRSVRIHLDGRVTAMPVSGGAWSPTGAALLGLDRRGALALWRDGRVRVLAPPAKAEPCQSMYGVGAWLDERRVVVSSGRGGQHDAELWTSDRTGGGPHRLHDDAEWSASPEWSPDGSRVVYERGQVHTHGGGCSGPLSPQLRIAAADGSADRPLTPLESAFHRSPRWSPDGAKVAYHLEALSDSREAGVAVVTVATGTVRRLAIGYGDSVSWSMDSRRIAFGGRGAIWIADVATGNVERPTAGLRPEWSPTAGVIAFVRAGELWIVAGDGSPARRLAPLRPVGELRWSRDGSLLTFAVRDGIVIVGRDGRVRQRIAHAGAGHPRFARDGSAIAYAGPVGHWSRGAFSGSLRTELFVADLPGGSPRRITTDYADVGAPSWR